jgi:transcription elongation factor Elf1
MAYPDLPPSPTFYKCPHCGNEGLFRASGIGSITCGDCGKVSSQDELLAEHARAHPGEALPAH